MPSPIGHSLLGLIIYRATGGTVESRQWQLMALYVLAANAADLDFVPGVVVGNLGKFHHGASHSITFSILFGLVAGALCSRKIFAFVISTTVYSSHVLSDYLVQDPSYPFGIPLLWPWSDQYYMAPFAFLPRVDYPPDLLSAKSYIFSLQNLATLCTEVLFFVPIFIFVSFTRRSSPA